VKKGKGTRKRYSLRAYTNGEKDQKPRPREEKGAFVRKQTGNGERTGPRTTKKATKEFLDFFPRVISSGSAGKKGREKALAAERG